VATFLYFNNEQRDWTMKSAEFAEDLISRFYNLAYRDWQGLHYDLKTLAELEVHEITDQAFAQLARYEMVLPAGLNKPAATDFYRICIQDHKILDAVENRDDGISFCPLVLYIVTHELVHIVRFSKLLKQYEIPGEGKEIEEARVHKVTCQILKNVSIPGLDKVLGSYRLYSSLQSDLFN
jgi:hypothetical protein